MTFVLEGNAGYIFNGGATVNITAPTSNCVSPSAYPESAYENQASPYDGTDGEGICGIAIYQARGDTTGDTVDEGAGSTFNGAIYAPSAPLTISGAGRTEHRHHGHARGLKQARSTIAAAATSLYRRRQAPAKHRERRPPASCLSNKA